MSQAGFAVVLVIAVVCWFKQQKPTLTFYTTGYFVQLLDCLDERVIFAQEYFPKVRSVPRIR